MAPPILGSVPLPISSISTIVFASPSFAIVFILVKWLLYVDSEFSMLCSSPMSTITSLNIRVTLPFSTGTIMPHCVSHCSSPTVFRHTLFPPAFGPEISNTCLSSLIRKFIGTTVPIFSSNNGCRASLKSITAAVFPPLSFILSPLCLTAHTAFALQKSSSSITHAACSISRLFGRNRSVTSVRILFTSSRSAASTSLTLLFTSTAASGSI